MTNRILGAIPVLPITDSVRSREFYCDRLGFTHEWTYRPHEDRADPAYMGLQWDDAFLHLSSFSGDGQQKTVVVLAVADVDALHRFLVERGTAVALEPTDQSWGTRELYVEDPDGNSVRFVQAKAA